MRDLRRMLIVPVCLASLSLPRPTFAQSDVELVDNGNFDIDLAGWTFVPEGGGSSMSWDPLDVDVSSGSGSVRVEVDPADIGNTARPFQCVPVAGGGVYDIGAWLFLPSTTAFESNFIRVQWFTEADCNGPILNGPDIVATAIPDTWVQLATTDAIAPGAARSASISLIVFEDPTFETNRIVYWDSVTFVPEASNASLAIAVLWTLGLRRRWRGATRADF